MTRRHHLLNPEWWTLGRKLKGVILALGALAAAYLAIVNANEAYNKNVSAPYHLKCFISCNDSINGPRFRAQETINRNMVYAILKIQSFQEVSISDTQRDQAAKIFTRDSIRMSKIVGGM